MVYDPESALPGFTSGASGGSANPTDQALAALAKGDYPSAETNVSQALRRNPRDPYALLAAGLLYQNTGRPNLARQAYQELQAGRVTAVTTFPAGQRLVPRSLSEIANINQGYLSGQPADMLANQAMSPARSDVLGVTQTFQAPPPFSPVSSAPLPAAATGAAGDPVLIAAQRFATLRELAENGLITEDEFRARRQANLGAILPLTQPAPGAGLDRPSPASQQIIARLLELTRSLERGAISPSEQNVERQMILEGLLPAQPRNKANPLPAPKDFMSAASALGRLERVKNAGLLTADEYAREREALDRIAQSPAAPQMAAAPSSSGKKAPAAASSGNGSSALPANLKGKPAVHLASYKNRDQAEKDIAMFKKKFPELAKLGMLATKVDLGAKGVYWRLKAGPLASAKAASALCAKLKTSRQFCEPSVFE